MTSNHEKIQHVPKLIELMFKGELHCLHNGFLRMETQHEVANELFAKE